MQHRESNREKLSATDGELKRLDQGCLSWFGNGVVIFVLYKQRASLQPTDRLTFNLAISDAAISAFGYSRGIVEIFNLFRDDGFIIKWVWTCQVDGFFSLLFGLASINTLTVISVTRYIKGCHPSKAYCIGTSTINISLLCIWTAALFWATMPLIGWGSYTDHRYGTCEIDWSKANYSTIYKFYTISLLISCFFIPALVMLFSYVSVINTLKIGNTMSADGYLTDRQRKVERDVTRVSIVICTAFIVAWSPYAVMSMWSAWGFHVPSTIRLFTQMFAKSASFYSPLVYFTMSRKFRRDVSVHLRRARESTDAVRLQRFKALRHKDGAAATAAASAQLAPHQRETNDTVGQDLESDLLSGVISPPNTPTTSSEELPATARDAGEHQSDRL
ncbi:opsin-5-like isoform X2 [Denticeps clupeoides]|uniref:G-protein coupled receptors family 1 profile domain-containing protein n=1 Tax=Denticeps clupeoides TaxID=299321 RepID=A0AAY4C3M9_9TELE|nr:opsin-5-like isoform X2 [Denticeps clupeoides]